MQLPSYLQDLLNTFDRHDLLSRENIQNAIRLIVIITSYLLLRPHIAKFFAWSFGAPNREDEEMKARLQAQVDAGVRKEKVRAAVREGEREKEVRRREAVGVKDGDGE
jgi:hypothetical protein